MKKLFVFIVLLFVLIVSCIPSYAYTNTDIYSIDELKQCENIILDSANRILESQNKSQIDSDDIDYAKAIKIFVNANILDNEELDNEMLQNYLESAEYIYYLPVYVDGNSVYLTVSKGRELTERARTVLEQEDIERLESLVGKWFVPEIQIYPYIVDFNNDVELSMKENGINEASIYYFGGISGNIPLVAVICSNDSGIKFKIVKEIKNQSDLSLGGEENQKEDIFSYEEIKKIASENGELKEGQLGSVGQSYFQNSNGNIFLIIFSIFVILPLIIMIIWIANKKQKEKKYD